MRSIGKPTVEELLRNYSGMPIKRFFQVDGVVSHSIDENTSTILYDLALRITGEQYELRADGDTGMPVSILIHEKANQGDVVSLLRMAANCLEESWHAVTVPEFLERIEQQAHDEMIDRDAPDDAPNDLPNNVNDDEQPSEG